MEGKNQQLLELTNFKDVFKNMVNTNRFTVEFLGDMEELNYNRMTVNFVSAPSYINNVWEDVKIQCYNGFNKPTMTKILFNNILKDPKKLRKLYLILLDEKAEERERWLIEFENLDVDFTHDFNMDTIKRFQKINIKLKSISSITVEE